MAGMGMSGIGGTVGKGVKDVSGFVREGELDKRIRKKRKRIDKLEAYKGKLEDERAIIQGKKPSSSSGKELKQSKINELSRKIQRVEIQIKRKQFEISELQGMSSLNREQPSDDFNESRKRTGENF